MSHRILVLSDLHLGEINSDPRYHLFLEVLNRLKVSDVHELFLAGDIFDILIGAKRFWTQIHAPFFHELAALREAGKRIVWVQGNHDLQLADLLRRYGVHWIEGEEVLCREQVRIYLSHGDLANGSDPFHPLWRSVLTSESFGRILGAIPEFIAKKALYPLAKSLSQCSRRMSRTGKSAGRYQETFRNFARQIALQHEAQLVILGHSHLSDYFPLSNSAFYLNVGSWLESTSLALIDIKNQHFVTKVLSAETWLNQTSK